MWTCEWQQVCMCVCEYLLISFIGGSQTADGRRRRDVARQRWHDIRGGGLRERNHRHHGSRSVRTRLRQRVTQIKGYVVRLVGRVHWVRETFVPHLWRRVHRHVQTNATRRLARLDGRVRDEKAVRVAVLLHAQQSIASLSVYWIFPKTQNPNGKLHHL